MSTSLYLVQYRFLENNKQSDTTILLVKSREELVEKLSDRLNSFGVYSDELEETIPALDTNEVIHLTYSSRYSSNCLLELQVLDQTELP